MKGPQYRVFFDTSVYIAALISPKGAAGELVRLAEAHIIRMVVSREVIIESDHVLLRKFPGLIQESRRLWKHLAPEMAPDPTSGKLKSYLSYLDKGDARILCSAQLSGPDVFVTWNTRDFMKGNIKWQGTSCQNGFVFIFLPSRHKLI